MSGLVVGACLQAIRHQFRYRVRQHRLQAGSYIRLEEKP
jgi:hypothetical protein